MVDTIRQNKTIRVIRLDGGRTLTKMPIPCLPTIEKENRDPKVYWHEETQAYVMVREFRMRR